MLEALGLIPKTETTRITKNNKQMDNKFPHSGLPLYLFFTKLFSLCGLISTMTVLAAVTAHALGHIHTDPTEYLTLIKSMKT